MTTETTRTTPRSTAYWFCREDMTSPNAPLTKWREGQTRTLRGGEITPCQRGYHGSPTPWDALQYAPGPMLCLVELSGDLIEHGDPVDKYAARTRKLVRAVNIERLLREFAIECAESVLPIFEAEHPGDARPRLAVEAARGFLAEKVTHEDLDAARDAARDAAWAARDAARDAAWAARDAARDAAWDARDAARDAAWAAWAAARAAARDAAWDAAWDAARDAARDAAWAAARDAERARQRDRFNTLCEEALQ